MQLCANSHGRVAAIRRPSCTRAKLSPATRAQRLIARAAPGEKFIPAWRDCYSSLQSSGLQTVAPEEAAELLATGNWVLLDVRRPDQHEEAHPQGAVNVPMYRKMDMSNVDLAKVMKVIAFSFNGVQAIDSNTAFASEALAAAPGKKFIVACEAGGTMKQTVNFPLGKPSRSLQAAYKLVAEGGVPVSDVVHLERGVYGWYQANLPINGEYVPDLGRTPMAAQEPALQSITQSTGYEARQGDKELQPAEKKNWWGF